MPNPSNVIPARLGPKDTLLLVKKGASFGPFVGYTADPNDCNVLKLSVKECKYRSMKYDRICGGVRPCVLCAYHQTELRLIDCIECKVNDNSN